MRAVLPLILPLALAGCAAVDRDDPGRERAALERALAGRVQGEPVACVPRRQNTSLRAVDRRTIVYDAGPDIWVNRLEGDCPGLRPDSILIVETFADRYCRLDRVRAVDRGASIPGPLCPLGNFIPYRRRD